MEKHDSWLSPCCRLYNRLILFVKQSSLKTRWLKKAACGKNYPGVIQKFLLLDPSVFVALLEVPKSSKIEWFQVQTPLIRCTSMGQVHCPPKHVKHWPKQRITGNLKAKPSKKWNEQNNYRQQINSFSRVLAVPRSLWKKWQRVLSWRQIQMIGFQPPEIKQTVPVPIRHQ